MSAYIVSKDQIDAMVTAWIELARPEYKNERRTDANEIGQMLWHENHLSIKYLYGANHPEERDRETPAYVFRAVRMPIDARAKWIPVLFKILDCYEYQSCEHTGWNESRARTLIDQMRKEAWSKLEGYEDAPWGIGEDERDLFTKAVPAAAALRVRHETLAQVEWMVRAQQKHAASWDGQATIREVLRLLAAMPISPDEFDRSRS